MPRTKFLISLCAAAFALSSGQGIANVSLEEQRSVILECKKQRGIGGAAYIEQRRSSSSSTAQMQVQIAPYDRVTTLDARNINACAAGRLGLAEADINAINTRNKTIVRSIRNPAGYKGSGCGRNPTILYRGDLYCQWAKR